MNHELLKAVKSGSLQKIQLALSLLPDGITMIELNKEFKSGDNIMHYCARLGHVDLIKYLHEQWKMPLNKVNNDHKTLLHESASFKNYDCTLFLLQHQVDVNALKHGDWTPLMMACTKPNNVDIVKLLIKYGANYHLKNKDGWTCFHIACRVNAELVTALLAIDNTLWNSISKNMRTPLHTACINEKVDVVKALIEHCIPFINRQDSCGNTPFMDAIRCGNLEMIKLLHDHGADIDIRDNMGRHALHICAELGVGESVKFLITECQVDPNILTVFSDGRKGQTPLHWAYKEKQIGMVKLLSNLGADEVIADWKKRVPSDMLPCVK